MTDEQMRAIYRRDEYGYSIGQSLDADKERVWRVKFLAATIIPALIITIAWKTVEWLLS